MIIPTFNGGSGLERTIASLHRQTLRPVEIIVIDDGSTDQTRAVALRARALGTVDMVLCHGTRCGRSPAINAAARFASGDLLLTVDADTVFEPTAVARLAAVFDDPRVGGASCNIAISNERESLWTGLQSVEYMMSISAGRSVLDIAGAIGCLSGACAIIGAWRSCGKGAWTSALAKIQSTRCGFAGSATLFASCRTPGRKRMVRRRDLNLLRQRARWDRDALQIRFMMYGELGLFHRYERLPDTLQRLDFIIFDLVPTLSLPFYLVYVVLLYGLNNAALFFGCDLLPAPVDLDFQHGTCVCHVQSNDRPFRSWRHR